MTSLISTTTGEIYESTLDAFLGGVAPTLKLPADHPFRTLWLDFRTKLTTPLMCDLLIDCYVAVFLQDDQWTKGLSHATIGVHRDHIIGLIRDNPPDLVVLDQPVNNGYGIHYRREGVWPYVCITKHWVDEWMLAMSYDPNKRIALSFETVLKATLAHEIPHWLLTLVCRFYVALQS
jgi:hypothetical protein